MTESVIRICEIAFDKIDIVRITAIINKTNIASQSVFKKNDFVFEGILKNVILKDKNIFCEKLRNETKFIQTQGYYTILVEALFDYIFNIIQIN